VREEIRELLDAYVEEIKARAPITSEAVERAFRRVERHRLLERYFNYDQEQEFDEIVLDGENPDPEHLKRIYSDTPLPTRVVDGLATSSTSQPTLVAQMLELLELAPGQRVLEIGAGTGYNAALVQEIVGEEGQVTTIDIQEEVVAQTRRLLRQAGFGRIEVLAKDGAQGHPENAPYDRIIATVGCPDISLCWAEQLADSGFMLIPLQHGPEGHNPLVRIWKKGGRTVGRFVGSSGFMTIQGELAAEQKVGFASQDKEKAGRAPVERPLPKSISTWSDLGRRERGARQVALATFLAITDGRGDWAGMIEKGRGACVLAKDKVKVYGDLSLYDELVQLCAEWERLGWPGLDRWALKFFPRDGLQQPEADEYTWVIPRTFTLEVAQLLSAPGGQP